MDLIARPSTPVFAALLVACGGAVEPAEPAAPPAAVEEEKPDCQPLPGRPPAGQAALEQRPDQDHMLVRYAATPGDAPCEGLDIALRLQSGLLVGEPSREVELVWTAAREIQGPAPIIVVIGESTATVPSEVGRRDGRVQVVGRGPAALLHRLAAERHPTFVIAGRRIELSTAQTLHFHRFLRQLPAPDFVRGGPAGPGRAVARAPIEADPAAGRGWFCVEAQEGANVKKRASSCHRTAAECEESRAALRAGGRVGDCTASSAAECYSWRAGGRTGRSCFYRPSQCSWDATRREEAEGPPVQTSGCTRVE